MDGTAKGKRGRKRQPEEDGLTPEERNKKQKNRDAAKKCRQKKEKEAKELKSRNEQLEQENKGLSQEKNELKDKVKFYVQVIQLHLDKGCELPPNVKAIWDQEEKRFYDDSEEDMETTVAADTLLQVTAKLQTPPHTPESPSNGKLSPDNSRYQMSVAPTALFSGNPLPMEEMNKRRRCSSNVSSSPSSSPGPSSSPSPSQFQNLNQIFRCKNIPPVLNPIKTGANRNSQKVEETNQISQRLPYQNSVQRVPSVVEELESLSGDESQNYSSDVPERKMYWSPIPEKNKGSLQSVTESEVIQRAMKQPDVALNDEVAREMYMQPATELSESNSKLPSLGFNISNNLGYSFTQDLHNIESTEAIIKEVGMENEAVHTSYTTAPAQYSHTVSQGQVIMTTGNDAVQPSIEVCSSALLNVGTDMTWDLQQQIKASYSSRLLTAQRDQSSQAGSESSQALSQKIVMTPRQMVQLTDEQLKQRPENIKDMQQLCPGNKNLSEKTQLLAEVMIKLAERNPNLNSQFKDQVCGQMVAAQQLQQVSHDVQKNYIIAQRKAQLSNSVQNSQFLESQTSNDSNKDGIIHEQPSASTHLPQTATFATGHTGAMQTSERREVLSNDIQTVGVAESGSLKSLKSQDFSCILQGLPSLGFNDLSSETNIFEKTPSNGAV